MVILGSRYMRQVEVAVQTRPDETPDNLITTTKPQWWWHYPVGVFCFRLN